MVIAPAFRRLTLVIYSSQCYCWKIIDFGCSSNGDAVIQTSTSSGRGSPGYRGPEIISEESFYSFATDIWAVGCLYYELRTKQKLFKGDFQTMEWAKSTDKVKSLPDEPCILDTWKSEQDLLSQMVHRNWEKRPTASKLGNIIETSYVAQCFKGGSGII